MAGWLQDGGYEKSLVGKQIDRVGKLDKEKLLANVDKGKSSGSRKRIPLVLTYHPGLNGMERIVRDHRAVFPEPPVAAFRRCKNLKDMLVRARLTNN